MTPLELISLAVLSLYVTKIAILLRAIQSVNSDGQSDALPSVSIVIAARNEEENIGECLDSVCRQTYPPPLFEVIVVDDESSDRTREVVLQKSEIYPNILLVHTQPEPRLQGKGRALAQGIDRSRNEIVLITDADCTVPTTWVEETARHFTGSVGLVGGMTLQTARNAFEGMQSLDWAYLLGLAAGATAMGVSFGSIGNNLSFRRLAYDLVGGYRAIRFSITEDYALVRAIRATRKWDHVCTIDADMLVESKACRDWGTLLRQKHRWGRGGLEVPPVGFLVMAVGWCVLAAPILAILADGHVTFGSTILLVKTAADYLFVRHVLVKLHRLDHLRWFWAFECWFSFYVTVLPFMVFFGRTVRWKGRIYR